MFGKMNSFLKFAPMYRDKSQPSRSAGNSIRSHREQKEFFMFSKVFPSRRGSHSSSHAAKAAIAGTTLVMLGMTAGTVSAGTIYQDSFTGSATLGTLNGKMPNMVDTNNAKWTANSSSSYGWSDSGYDITTVNDIGAENAYLPFTPIAGQIYTLSAGLDMTAEGLNPNNTYAASTFWMGLGFLSSPGVVGGWTNSGAAASPWVLSGYQGANNVVFTGPGTGGGQGFSTGTTSGVNDYSIVLNTGSSLWTYQVYLTNSANTNLLVGSSSSAPFSSNPNITAVGFENGLGVAQVSNFSLTDVAVPEPATLGLLAVGGLGLLLLKRRKTV